MSIRKTQAEFDQIRPLLARRMSDDLIAMVEQAMVEGISQTAIAKARNITRQAVYFQITRAIRLMDDVPEGWVSLDGVWLPSDRAEEVRYLSESLRIRLAGGQKKAPRAP